MKLVSRTLSMGLIALAASGAALAQHKVCGPEWVKKNAECTKTCADKPPQTREFNNCVRTCRGDHLVRAEDFCTPPPPKAPEPTP
jgi:hypothetical protein